MAESKPGSKNSNIALGGSVTAVSISTSKGTPKTNVAACMLKKDFGIEGDAHAGKWHRQVSLLAEESIQQIKAKGVDVTAGDFAENITTKGLELWRIPLGSIIAIGGKARLEVTQIGKECHRGCAIFKQVGDCVMPRQGIFARVLTAGKIKPGDRIEIILP